MSLVECYTREQREIMGIKAGSDFEPALPHLGLTVEIGGRVLGAGIGLYFGNLFKDQKESASWVLLSGLAGYVLFNTAAHYLTDRLWGTKEYIPWYKRLNQW